MMFICFEGYFMEESSAYNCCRVLQRECRCIVSTVEYIQDLYYTDEEQYREAYKVRVVCSDLGIIYARKFFKNEEKCLQFIEYNVGGGK